MFRAQVALTPRERRHRRRRRQSESSIARLRRARRQTTSMGPRGDVAAPLGGGDSPRAATDPVGTPSPTPVGWSPVRDSAEPRARLQPLRQHACSANLRRAEDPALTAGRGRSESGARTSSPASDRARAAALAWEDHRSNGPRGLIEAPAARAAAVNADHGPARVRRSEEIRPPRHADTSCAAPSAARLCHRRRPEEANDLHRRLAGPVRGWPGPAAIRFRSRFFAPPQRNFNSLDRGLLPFPFWAGGASLS